VFLDIKYSEQFEAMFIKLFKPKLPLANWHKIPEIVQDIEPKIRYLYLKRFGHEKSLPNISLFP